MHNCDLINLEDMLQNGTVISGTLIERPHSFSTACNIATQIIAQVASCQYGGQSISLTHLAPFVGRLPQEDSPLGLCRDGGHRLQGHTRADRRGGWRSGLRDEGRQWRPDHPVPGRHPHDHPTARLRSSRCSCTSTRLAASRRSTTSHSSSTRCFRQRYQGVKNEAGVWITPAFPKLIYVLEPDNVTEGSPYFYLPRWCQVHRKRMVPDLHLREEDEGVQALQGRGRGRGRRLHLHGCRSFLTAPNALAMAMTTWPTPETTSPESRSTTVASTRAS